MWLRDTARELEKMGLAQEHELAGIVFQKLIDNRKILKANYTRPESSALLCALALPELNRDPKKTENRRFRLRHRFHSSMAFIKDC